MRDRKRFIVRADEKLTALLKLEATIRKIRLTSVSGSCQNRARAKSVGRLRQRELHLIFFPQG
jgi:DNA-directed RNA polymerase alpha subunit